jgi:hypothetical protein
VPRFRTAASLAFVVLLAGCGAGKDEAAPARSVKRADLGRMIVSKQDLGPLAKGLPLNGHWSGRSDNKKATEDTVDPRDTAKTLTRAGRVQGYDRTYAARSHPSALGVLVVSQGVELFHTEKAASVYMNKQLADFKRFRGRRLGGRKLAQVEKFDVDVGDEAGGVRLRVVYPSQRITVFLTIVGFRRGRVVGYASAQLRRDLLVSGDVERIADALDERVTDVVSGKHSGSVPSAIRNARRHLSPKPLTLRGEDFPVGTTLAHQGSIPGPGVRVYVREYDVLGGRLAGSKIFYLRSVAQVFDNARFAARDRRYLATAKGADTVARRFLRAAFKTGDFHPRKVTARPLRWPGSDTAAFHFFFRVPKGRVEGVLLSVTHGRLSGSVLVMGFDQDVEPAAVLAMREKLRGRLRGH